MKLQPINDSKSNSGDGLATSVQSVVCAWCGSIEVTDAAGTHWIENTGEVILAGEVTHGICPSCAARARNHA